MLSFFVAVLLRPEIQKMAQEELDTVTRRERLPTFEDRPKLPFVDAVCKEVMRWRPISPLGELLRVITSSTQIFDSPQVYPTQILEMTSMRVSLSQKVCILGCLFPSCWVICHSRCSGDNEHVVRYLHYFSRLASDFNFVGQSFKTLPHTQNQILLDQNGSLIQMEACVMIRC